MNGVSNNQPNFGSLRFTKAVPKKTKQLFKEAAKDIDHSKANIHVTMSKYMSKGQAVKVFADPKMPIWKPFSSIELAFMPKKLKKQVARPNNEAISFLSLDRAKDILKNQVKKAEKLRQYIDNTVS